MVSAESLEQARTLAAAAPAVTSALGFRTDVTPMLSLVTPADLHP